MSFWNLVIKNIHLLAKYKSELIYESKVLNHCVGHLPYDRKQAEEQSLICFIRPINDLVTPYCTLELDLRKMNVSIQYS